MSQILDQLSETLRERRTASPQRSYTASLFAAGLPAMRAKLEEELAELLQAAEQLAADPDSAARRHDLVHEAADLWFHSMVLLVANNAGVEDVLAELERRFGVSGHEEKRSRGSS